MEYRQTWKQKTTPLGRSYWEHTASPHRTSETASGGWATPRSVESGHATGNPDRALDHKSRLEDQVYLAGWPTPTCPSDGGIQANPEAARERLDAHAAQGTRVTLRDWRGPVPPHDDVTLVLARVQ